MRLLALLTALAVAAPAATPEYGYTVVHVYPHDRAAFPEGLFYRNGFLYGSTGLDGGRSSVRKVKLETGEVVQRVQLPDQYFGEGIIQWKDKLYQLTYTTEVGFIFDINTFAKLGEFR